LRNLAFVESLLHSWLNYIDIDDKAAASIGTKKINEGLFQEANKNIRISNNNMILGKEDFDKIKEQIAKEARKSTLALSFPRIKIWEDKQYKYRPLFVIDVQYVFKGEYQEGGWDLSSAEFIPSTLNLQRMLPIDDEEVAEISNRCDILEFINTTLGIAATTIESSLDEIKTSVETYNSAYKIDNKPYLFEYTGEGFNYNLKKDFQAILTYSQNYLNAENLAVQYISNKIYEAPRLFLGALGSFPPTHTQSLALYQGMSNPITAVQGPPGSGKTSLIMNVVASQITKRALQIIRHSDDLNNFTIITSTNNRAVNNAVEKLLELNSEDKSGICLVGGNQKHIKEKTVEQVNKKIKELETHEFDAQKYSELQTEIIKLSEKIRVFQERGSSIVSNIIGHENDIERFNSQSKECEEGSAAIRKSIEQRLESNRLNINVKECLELDGTPYLRILESLKQLSLALKEGGLINKIKNALFDRKTKLFREFGQNIRGDVEKTYQNEFPRIYIPTDEESLKAERKKVKLIAEIIDDIDKYKRSINKMDQIKRDISECQANITNCRRDFDGLISEIAQDNKVGDKTEVYINKLAYKMENLMYIYNELFFETNKGLFLSSKEFLFQHALLNKGDNIQCLERYLKILQNDKIEIMYVRKECQNFFRQLSLVFPVASSTLHSASRLCPFTIPGVIDKVIVDEAGMIPCHQVFPILFRANSTIVVGDPYQIEPVISHGSDVLDDFREDSFLSDLNLDDAERDRMYYYFSPSSENATAFHLAATNNFDAVRGSDRYSQIRLKEHFRCQADIARYFDEICRYGLEVKTKPEKSKLGTNLLAYNVNGSECNKVNASEIEAVLNIVEHLLKNGYQLSDIGIISPYKVHSEAIKRTLKKMYSDVKNDDVGTVHTFQGGQKKVIICSTKITNSRHSSFINRKPNILNVAVSRAEELFILVGDLYTLRKSGSFLERLVEHIEKYGQILEINPVPSIVQSSQQNLILDCEHLAVFQNALRECERELIVVTPWIREEAAWSFFRDIQNTRYSIKILYGWGPNDDNDEKVIEKIKALPNVELINMNVKEQRTHEKILICDEKYAVVGSWNWLSNKYQSICERRGLNEKIVVRHEMSVKLEVKEDIIKIKKLIEERL
jgi:hypothetical protein